MGCLTVALVLGGPALLGVQKIEGEAPRALPSSTAEFETRWDDILAGTVHDGVVDYGALADRRDALARLVGALAIFGPRSTPSAFEGSSSTQRRFAYYINAYNAFVIFAMLERDVRTSVRDVRGWLEPADGLGFFWAQRFELDGETLTLHGLENDILRRGFWDARVHAALNCASASCPDMLDHAYHAEQLERELQEAARWFSEAPHVVVDEAQHEVQISSIYTWYAGDFAAEGDADHVLSWIARHAAHPAAIRRARREGWPIRYLPYDWRLNGHW